MDRYRAEEAPRFLNSEALGEFRQYLQMQEKSRHTVEKYLRDVLSFVRFLAGSMTITKEAVIRYKEHLAEHYAIRSVNSMLASLNAFFTFLGWYECKVRTIRMQREIYCPTQKELTREEYVRLVQTARHRGDERLSLILQTICGTGIRISELASITAEAVQKGEAIVYCKNKTRTVFIVQALRSKLLKYLKKNGICSGSIFVNRSGMPLGRTTVWRDMNLRHLFARVFYNLEKDIAKLADILGHSSINTTRIYIISTGSEHRQRMENMRLVL